MLSHCFGMLCHCFGRSIGAARAPTSCALVGLLFATAFPSPALATTVNVGQTLDLGGVNQTVISLSGGGIVTNSGPPAATLTNQGPSSTFSGVIEDGGGQTSLAQNSAGNTLTLSGLNTYTGGTTIAAGTLQIGGAGLLGGGSYDGAIVNNGIFEYSSSAVPDPITLVSQDLTGVFSGSGSLIKDTSPSSSLLRLSGDAKNFTGETTVSAGILSIAGLNFGSASAPAGPINIGPGGVFSTSGASSIFSTSITNAGVIDNDGTIIAGALSNLVGASLTNNGTLTDNLNNAGSVVNNGTYTANVASNSGTITNNAFWYGSVNNSGGTITNNFDWFGSANNAGGTINNTGVWTGSVNNTAGTITNAEFADWSGSANNTGGTIKNAGMWTGDITNRSGTVSNDGTGTIVGGVSNSGILGNSGTITGAVTNSGILGNAGTITGAVTNSGILGNAGTIDATKGGFTNTSSGLALAAAEINGGIQNSGRFAIAGALASGGAFTNNGTVETFAQAITELPSTAISALEPQLPALTPLILTPPTSTTLTTPSFNNYGAARPSESKHGCDQLHDRRELFRRRGVAHRTQCVRTAGKSPLHHRFGQRNFFRLRVSPRWSVRAIEQSDSNHKRRVGRGDFRRGARAAEFGQLHHPPD